MKKIFTWGRPVFFTAALLSTVVVATAQTFTNGGVHLIGNYGQMPLRFEPNTGQTDPQVRYISRGNGYGMYFLPTEIALALDAGPEQTSNRHQPFTSERPVGHKFGLVHIKLAGANEGAVISAEQILPEKVNYLLGSDPAQWRTGVSVYGRVHYQNIYPGVDLEFYGNQTHLEYDFVIAPHANPKAIQLRLEGADTIKIDPTGDLVFSFQGQTTRFVRPVIYQTIGGARHEIAGGYRLQGNRVSFEVGAYDKSQPLVIDPVLSYSTFLGGMDGSTWGTGIAADSAGNTYMCGYSTSQLTNLVTPGAFQTTNYGKYPGFPYNAIVAKIGPTGTNLVYLTFLGGNGYDGAYGIAVDSVGNAYVTGFTTSSNYPVKNALYPKITTAYISQLGSYGNDGFVTELNTNGSQLVFSTYFGGTNASLYVNLNNFAQAIALDAQNNIYIGGWTDANSLPVTNALQSTAIQIGDPMNPAKIYNGFVTKFSSNATSIVYCTYYEGSAEDRIMHIAVDPGGNLYGVGYNNGTIYVDSTHLLALDFKPDGRVVQNIYDNQRRVTVQLATVGQDLNVYTNAVFIYSNNFVLTNAWTNHITGYTLIKDVNGNTNRYDYANSLVTTNTDQLGQKIIQIWYADNATAPGYPRSLYQTRDKRGLWTQFQYDSNGNATNVFSWGDLTGDGTTQYATNSASYNSNNLLVQRTDPIGNSVQTVYQSQYPYLPQFVIYAPNGTPTVTNQFAFGNVTNVVVNGNLTLTNMAFGLLLQQVRAANSSDAATNQWSFDGRGYLTQSIQFTGTGDSAVVNNFTCNNQGEIIERTDAAGQRTDFAYDDMRRPIAHEIFAAGQTAPMFWEYAYYNANGELNWYDGPRYNPEDYQWFDYDGAGRLTTQIKWRAEANSSGTGMEPPAGYNLYAQTFYQYDKFNNLTLAVDPRGAMTTNSWDKIGQLVRQQHLDTNGATVLSSEGFVHEPGGQVSAYTNALGGVASIAYTTNGLPKFRSNPDGSTNAWRYYLDGRIKQEIQGNGAYWQTAYDDVNRIITRIFYSPTGVPEATNAVSLDRRGNVIQRVDAGGNVFTTTFDGLDRVKITAGPAIVTVTSQENPFTFQITYVTNVLQQAVTNFFDAAGLVTTNVNALGETTVTDFDPVGRPTQAEIFSASGSLVRQRTYAYSPDYHSVTITDGSGASAVTTTAFTDNDGQNVLSVAYPAANATEFMLRQFDLAGNLVADQHNSSASGNVTTWTTASYGYDGLNRLISKTDRDGALTTYGFDAMGDLTNRAMPGNLQWRATYSNAGQILKDWNMNGTPGTRTNSYSYFASGSPFAGLLQTKIDGRNTTNNYSYDDWLRPTNMACTGSLPEQNLTTTWQYEPRGFVTQIGEQFASTNTGPATAIQRSFDPYGELASESVNAGSFSYGTSQSWDDAGRRSILNIGGAAYGFGWQADGNLTVASNPTGNGSYSFDTAGLLTSRYASPRQTTIGSRDGEGRPLSITTTVNGMTALTESLAYSGDGLLSADTLYRSDFTDSRSYGYANLSRRLTQEQLNLNASTVWTNTMVYDNGIGGGLGVLTKLGAPNTASANWNGVADAFSRVNAETNNTFAYPAYGHANGQATLYAWLDYQSVPITALGTNAMQWRASMELSSGAHKLIVAAAHPSGFYTAWATNSFTNNIAYQKTTNTFDGAGNITVRIWKNPNGTTNRTQTLSWDARGRLHTVTDRDTSNSGYNWTATYDGLNRRLSTITALVTNGVVYSSSSQTLNSFYDPQAEFLELGVQNGSQQTTWKLYGPDLDGTYGGENGMGGLDAVSPYLNLFDTTISDARGDILGYYDPTQGSVTWNPARPTGYGAVPGYRPPTPGNGVNLAQSSAWRGRWPDITGYLHLGARDFDPVSGRWLSHDPIFDDADPNGFSMCGGDPVNRTDPNGKCVENKPPVMYAGIAPEMQASLQTTLYFNDGHSVTTGGPGQPAVVYDPNNLGGRSYNVVVEPTGRSFFYISKQPLPANYGQTTVTPITKYDVQMQEDKQFLFASAVFLSTMATDTERFAPELLAANRLSVAEASLATAETTAARTASGDFYSVAFQTRLDPADFALRREWHFQIANEALQAERGVNPALAELVPKPVGWGRPPAGWTWQHATIEQGGGNAGVMQLVPRYQHTPGSLFWSSLHPLPGGAGGYSEWAIPAGAPLN